MDNEPFKFIITTDNHLGYKEDDHLRRKDSYMAFEEALEIARFRDVDFILLGGDLFHVNRPSASVEHKCIKIIRRHMNAETGRDKVSFKRVQGSFSHFSKVNHANFEDPNLKVVYPIMTIHGNHDDPTGPHAQSVCEKLATCGLLNYFGAVKANSKEIVIEPIVLQKGSIKIALYGLGFIPDYKLKQAFEKGEVRFIEPPADTFNVLVVHQNRLPLLKSKYIPDDIFPTFFHLIIRGHEHATMKPEPLPNSEVNGMVYQPGSTVATSISTMEAAPKKIGLVTVNASVKRGNKTTQYSADYEMIDLKRSRRMIFKDIPQKDIFKFIKQNSGTAKVTASEFKSYSLQYVGSRIAELLKDYQLNLDGGDSGVTPDKHSTHFRLPLLRIRLEYSSKNERFDDLELSSKFYPNLVANRDIILFKKQKLQETEDGKTENITFAQDLDVQDDDDDDLFDHIDLTEERRDTIDFMIESYFKEKPKEERLVALSLEEYTRAVSGATDDGNVISKVLNEKKQQILRRYKDIIRDEKVAEEQFLQVDQVKDWFVKAFQSNCMKNDQMDSILDEQWDEDEVMLCG